jgi:hypothetical protein
LTPRAALRDNPANNGERRMTMTDETSGPAQEPVIKASQNEARDAAMLIPVGDAGVELQNFAQQVDYAKWMAAAGVMIPKHLRGNVGACLAVLDMSQRWGFSPFQVGRMTYDVNGNIGLQAQLVHAVIDKFAPLEKRLRITYEGDGPERVCIVTGRFKGETEDCEYRSPMFAKITPKNSPLWTTDPDQQQAYLSVSRWARRFSPGTLMGLFSKEELEDAGAQYVGPDQAKDITPSGGGGLAARLRSKGADHPAEGFRDGVVEDGLNGALDGAAEAAGAGSTAAGTGAAAEADQATAGGPAAQREAVKPEPKAVETQSGDVMPPELKVPVSAATYKQWMAGWLKDMGSVEDVRDRWNAERTLRNKCGVTSEDRERLGLDAMKEARIAELKGAA